MGVVQRLCGCEGKGSAGKSWEGERRKKEKEVRRRMGSLVFLTRHKAAQMESSRRTLASSGRAHQVLGLPIHTAAI